MSQIQTPSAAPTKSRIRRTFEEATKRAPIELGLNRLHTVIVKHAMKRFRGTRHERALVQRFLLDLLSSEMGKAFTGGALATAIPYLAPMLGQHASKAEAVADELATRSFTVAQVALGGAILTAAAPVVDVVVSMLSGAGGADALPEQSGARVPDLSSQPAQVRG